MQSQFSSIFLNYCKKKRKINVSVLNKIKYIVDIEYVAFTIILFKSNKNAILSEKKFYGISA